eukprot:TRINITY_DN24689_c0_g1_i1.p1 TRINITY_DN24689_c0_g1~~TRINITY_DN24689_c0_g1_i1.p1  ORF type:complete len:466 (+),score=121.01 TRINITY_DN24689_c0_g1_i1:101-1399(+)
MPEVGLFAVAESSWWANMLYSLMRLDASYPNSTAVSEQELWLLGAVALAALAAMWVVIRFAKWVLRPMRKRPRRGPAPTVRYCVGAMAALAVGGLWELTRNAVETSVGAYDLQPQIPTEIPVIHEQPTPSVFRDRFRGQPVIVRPPSPNGLDMWQPGALAAAFENSSAAMQIGNVEQGTASYQSLRLGEFFSRLDDDDAAEKFRAEHGSVPYLAEENNILRHGGEHYMQAVDALFRQSVIGPAEAQSFHFTDVWIWAGPKGAQTGLHADWDPINILHQLYGNKTLWILPPQHSPYCYPSQKYDLGATIASVDPFKPDLKRYPDYAKAVPLRMDLRAGDIAQVPAGWMHYAQCESACIALSGRSFSFGQTMAALPGVVGAVLHRFGLYGGQSTSGYVGPKHDAADSAPAPGPWGAAAERLWNIHLYRQGEEYD